MSISIHVETIYYDRPHEATTSSQWLDITTIILIVTVTRNDSGNNNDNNYHCQSY